MRPWSPTGDSATAMGVAIKIIRRQSGAVMDCLPPAIRGMHQGAVRECSRDAWRWDVLLELLSYKCLQRALWGAYQRPCQRQMC